MCERCGRTNITSHHKCAGCDKWVGGCCLARPNPNLLSSEAQDNLCIQCDLKQATS